MRADSKLTSPNADPVDPQLGAPECADATDRDLTPAKPEKRKKKRAPQPTYDDGATTRLFKFPSRAYPKSSYYVTSTDIIIRIKKARKKRKLVLPKKRVVSYKTNRWFAKPRWVEIELTYTQALKNGLVDSWSASAEAEPLASEIATEVRDDCSDRPGMVAETKPATPDTAGPATDAEIADRGGLYATRASTVTTGVVAAPVPAAEMRFSAGALRPAFGKELPPMPAAGDPVAPLPAVSQHKTPTRPTSAPVPFNDRTLLVTQVLDRGFPLAAADRKPHSNNRSARNGAVMSALVLLIAAGTCWFIADVGNGIRPSSDTSMMSARPAGADVIPPPTAGGPRVAEIGGEIAPAGVPILEAQTGPAPIEVARAEVQISETPTAAPAAHAVAPLQPMPAPGPPAGHAEVASCRDRTAAAIDAVSIQFGYASADLPPVTFKVLDRLAALLRSCPALITTIAGHTDSDGHFDRNQRLSVRRAEAVRLRLIDAGIDPARLSAIGHGQMRPLAPNDTVPNKRRNRRIEFALEPLLGAFRP